MDKLTLYSPEGDIAAEIWPREGKVVLYDKWMIQRLEKRPICVTPEFKEKHQLKSWNVGREHKLFAEALKECWYRKGLEGMGYRWEKIIPPSDEELTKMVVEIYEKSKLQEKEQAASLGEKEVVQPEKKRKIMTPEEERSETDPSAPE